MLSQVKMVHREVARSRGRLCLSRHHCESLLDSRPSVLLTISLSSDHLHPPSRRSEDEPEPATHSGLQAEQDAGTHDREPMDSVPVASATNKPTKRRIPKDQELARLAYQDGVASEQ